MLNRITMTGRLVADPELRRTQSGVSVTSFRIANDRDYANVLRFAVVYCWPPYRTPNRFFGNHFLLQGRPEVKL